MRRRTISALCIALVLAMTSFAAFDDHEADSLLNILYSGPVQDEADRYNLLCNIAFASNNTDTALKYSAQALVLAEQLGENPAMPNIARGNAYFGSDQPVLALECYLEAAEDYQAAGNETGEAVAYVYIAKAYNAQDFHGTEQYYLNQAIEIFREVTDSVYLAVTQHNLGYSYYKTGDYGKALELFTETGPIFLQQNDSIYYAYGVGNTGLVYARMMEFDRAGEQLQRAIGMLTEQGETYATIEFMIAYAGILQHQGEMDEAIDYAIKSLSDASTYGYIEFECDAAKCLAQLYQASGRHDSAYHYLSLFASLNDSIRTASYENVQQMADLWTDIVVAGMQAELEVFERRRTAHWFVNGGLALILLLTVGFVVQYYFSLKRSRKLAASLEERGVLLENQSRELHAQKEVLMQQKEELQVTLENLRKTQEQLVESEKMAAVGSLVAGVAHEMNTPVGVGITAVSNLRDEVNRMAALYKEEKINGEELSGFLESADVIAKLIEKNLEKAATLIQSFTQISTDQVTEQQRIFACREYLNDIITSFRPKFSGKKIQVRIDCDEDLTLNSYPGVYAQIFTNLLSNSLQHGYYEKDRGTILIKVEQEDNDKLKIRYSDDGKGISKKDLHRIFEPFYTSDQHRGTGLGLNIIYNLVKQKLHGSITCTSEPGQGVTFTITVPNCK